MLFVNSTRVEELIKNSPAGKNTKFLSAAHSLWYRFKNYEKSPPMAYEDNGEIVSLIFATHNRDGYANLYEIVTLEGKELSWTIPAGTQHGARFRLGQYGLWNPSHPVRGSLIVQVNLSTPTNLTPEQLSVIERLSRELKTGNT